MSYSDCNPIWKSLDIIDVLEESKLNIVVKVAKHKEVNKTTEIIPKIEDLKPDFCLSFYNGQVSVKNILSMIHLGIEPEYVGYTAWIEKTGPFFEGPCLKWSLYKCTEFTKLDFNKMLQCLKNSSLKRYVPIANANGEIEDYGFCFVEIQEIVKRKSKLCKVGPVMKNVEKSTSDVLTATLEFDRSGTEQISSVGIRFQNGFFRLYNSPEILSTFQNSALRQNSVQVKFMSSALIQNELSTVVINQNGSEISYSSGQSEFNMLHPAFLAYIESFDDDDENLL